MLYLLGRVASMFSTSQPTTEIEGGKVVMGAQRLKKWPEAEEACMERLGGDCLPLNDNQPVRNPTVAEANGRYQESVITIEPRSGQLAWWKQDHMRLPPYRAHAHHSGGAFHDSSPPNCGQVPLFQAEGATHEEHWPAPCIRGDGFKREGGMPSLS